MLRITEPGIAPAQPLPLSSLAECLSSSSRSPEPLDYVNRRHVRQWRWCTCCLLREAASRRANQSSYLPCSDSEPVYGLAFQCEYDDFLLCQACYERGQPHHRHRSSHRFTKYWPLPPVQRYGSQQPRAPFSSSSSSPCPALVQELTFDTYEDVVYRDEEDVLVYYRAESGWTNISKPDPLQQSFAAIVHELQRQRAETSAPSVVQPPRGPSAALVGSVIAQAPTLDIIGFGYLAALSSIQLQQQSCSLPSSDSLRLVVASYDYRMHLDPDWIAPSAQLQPGMLMLHPAQPRKGHADMQRRNILWPACHPAATLQRITAFFSEWQPHHQWTVQQLLQSRGGWPQLPVFGSPLLFPSLDELIEWLHHTGSRNFDLPAALRQAEPYRRPFHWLCRAYQASNRLLLLIGSYPEAIDLVLLQPHCAAAQQMREMCALDRRHAPLQGIDVSWCEQHVPALEHFIVSLLNTEAMREARAAWLQLYEEGIAHMEECRALQEQHNAERFEWSAAGLRGHRRSEGDLLNRAHDAVTKKVVTANFESVVLDSERDVLLGLEWRMAPTARDLSLCIRLLIPAAARVIRLYQQKRGISQAAAQSAPPGHRQHGESLVFGIMLAGLGKTEHSPDCDLDVNWIDPDDYREILSCTQGMRGQCVGIGAGGFLLCPAGEKPSQEHYGFYSLMRSVYKQPLPSYAPWLTYVEQPFLQPFSPPTLSSLLRFVHAKMKGGTFDLDAVLALAAPYEASSVLVGRLQDAQQDVRDLSMCPGQGSKSQPLLDSMFLLNQLMGDTTLEALTDSVVFQAAPELLAVLDERKAKILGNLAVNNERKRKVAERKQQSELSKQSRRQDDERSEKQKAALQLVRPGKRNEAAVQRVLQRMRRMPMMDAWAWHPAAARLHLYVEPSTASSSSSRGTALWCLIFEVLGWWDDDSSMSADHVGELRIYAEGPAAVDDGCVDGWSDFCDEGSAVQHAHYEPDEKAEEDDGDASLLSPGVSWVRIREQRVPVNQDLDALAELGVTVEAPPRISKFEYLRVLALQHKDALLSSDDELRARMQDGGQTLVKLLQLEDWYHCDGSKRESTGAEQGADSFLRTDHWPSRNPTLSALAQCTVDRSAAHYRAVQAAGLLPAPNTHWSHWLHQGR